MAKEDRSLVEAQKRLLRKPVTSDITIKSGDRTWKCQSAILSQRCEFFRVATSGGFKEAQSRVITLHDDHPDAVDLMLLYLYTLEVPNLERTGDAEKCMLLGDKYDLPALHDGGRKAIESSIQRNVPRWHALTDLGKRQWVDFFERVWSWQIKNAIGIRTLLFAYLASVADILIEDTLFQDLLWENRGFNLAFVKAVIKEAKG